MNDRAAVIAAHYQSIWGAAPSHCNWPDLLLRAQELPQGFSVLRFEPTNASRTWKYATVCMSASGDEEPIELHLVCNRPEDDCAAILTLTAYFHRRTTRLGVGHSVNFGRPWVAKSRCTYGLISLPYLGGTSWESCPLDSGENARCLWMLPITPEEVKFKKDNGLEALEQRFEASGFNYENPWRASVL